jgi:signal transduction histidine kinase
MNLKNKLILLLLISGSILILLLYIAYRFTLHPSQEKQKGIFVDKLEKRLRIALAVEEKNIALLSANWADWESLALYVKSPSPEFEAEVFTDEIFNEDMIDVALVVPVKGDILFCKGYKNSEFLGPEHMKLSSVIDRIRSHIERQPKTMTAVISSGAGPVMIAAAPILGSESSKRLLGILLLGRFIDRKMMTNISAYTMEVVQSLDVEPGQLKDFYSRNMQGKDLFYKEDGETLKVYHLLKDINDEPAVVLVTSSDNEIFRVMNRHVIALVAFSLIAVVFLGVRIYFSIDKHIVKRVLTISRSMSKIEGLKDLSRRINKDNKSDEISRLVTDINIMLDKLEQEKTSREIAERSMITQGKLASIGRLASCIGHEVNNPLLAISNSIQVIKKLSRSKSTVFKEAIEISESELHRIRDIISSLLDFQRDHKKKLSQVDVKEVILKSLGVLEWSKKLGKTRVIRSLDDHCFVCGSPDRLKQVFINFIVNAVEAMENTTTEPLLQIDAKCSADRDFVEIHIADNGPGIPDEIKGHLFEPFVSTKETKGVGLGLYISYKIIDNHQGEIVYNDQYEKGAHFIIKLPVSSNSETCMERRKPLQSVAVER